MNQSKSFANIKRASLLFIATAAYWIWLHLAFRQSLPAVLFLVSVMFCAIALFVLSPYVSGKPIVFRFFSGFCVGYLSTVLSAMAATLVLYGTEEFFGRAFPAVLYDFPLISFGWAFGLFVTFILKRDT